MSDVAPGSSPDPEPTSTALAGMTPDQRANWRLTGDPNPTNDAPPDSSPVEPVEQVVSTDTSKAPESDPGTSQKTTPKLHARQQELQTEIDRLHEQLATRRRLHAELEAVPVPREPPSDAKPAASSPAAVVPLEHLVTHPDITRPPLNDTEFFTQYPDATLGDLTDYRTRHLMLRERAVQSVQSHTLSRQQAFLQRREQAIQANPEFLNTLDPWVKALVPSSSLPRGTTPGPLNDFAEELLDSSVSNELMVYLSEHPEAKAGLERLPHRAAVARELGRLEGKVTAVPRQSVSKTTTSAPAPAKTLGGRPATPANEAESAVAAGDFTRYKLSKNRSEVA